MTDSRLARENVNVVLTVASVASRLARLAVNVLVENTDVAATRWTPGTRNRRAGRTYGAGH